MNPIYYLPIFFFIFTLVASWYRKLKKEPDGPSREELDAISDEEARQKLEEQASTMRKFASIIRDGVVEIASLMFKSIFKVALVACVIIFCFLDVWSAPKFLFAVVLSSLGVIVGMFVAPIANIRVSERARRTLKNGKTVAIALDGGKIVGTVAATFAAFGVVILYIIEAPTPDSVGHGFLIKLACNSVITGFIAFSLGYSLVAMFCRVMGGVFTKMMDIAADIVGKVFFKMPEDDARNPATAADGTGDIVADCASNIADMGESYVATLVSALAASVYFQQELLASGVIVTDEFFEALRAFPIFISVVGVVASVLGLIITSKRKMSEDPEKELNIAMYISAILTGIFVLAGSYYYFGNLDLPSTFRLGWLSTFCVVGVGIISAVAVGKATEYFTSTKYAPVKRLARISYLGPAFNTTKGDAIGYTSGIIGLVIGLSITVVQYIAGPTYGIALAALGMMSFIGTTVSIDAFGPIADNAGGIVEASGLPKEVRDVTDAADRAGNTTAAVGKGFAISGAFYAALSMISTFSSASGLDRGAFTLLDPMVIVGIFIGAIVIRYFEGLLSDNTQEGAQLTADECVEQIKAVQEGHQEEADHKKVIHMGGEFAKKKMFYPSILCLVTTAVVGTVFGRTSAAGLQIGMLVVAVVEAFAMGNSGGAYDNCKKYIESGDFARDQCTDLFRAGDHKVRQLLGNKYVEVIRTSGMTNEEYEKAVERAAEKNYKTALDILLKYFGPNTEIHATTVIGDTKGDIMKDVICVCLDIFIKMVATSAVMMLPIFKVAEANTVAKVIVVAILVVAFAIKLVVNRRHENSQKVLESRVDHEIFSYMDRQVAVEESVSA